MSRVFLIFLFIFILTKLLELYSKELLLVYLEIPTPKKKTKVL